MVSNGCVLLPCSHPGIFFQEDPNKPRKILKAVRRRTALKPTATASEVPELSKSEQAQQASAMRIMTDEDFRRIDAAVISKQIVHAKKDKKRPVEETTNMYVQWLVITMPFSEPLSIVAFMYFQCVWVLEFPFDLFDSAH